MSILSESAARAVKESAEPVRAAVKEQMRDVRQAAVAARRAVEDRVEGTTLQVRRHPLMSLSIAVGAGTFLGGVIGFALGRSCRADRKPNDD